MINSYSQTEISEAMTEFKNNCVNIHTKKLLNVFDSYGITTFNYKRIRNINDLDSLSNTQGVYVIFSNSNLSWGR